MRRASLSLTAVALLVLAGCSTGDSTDAEVDPDAPISGEGVETDAPPTDPLDPACLIGDWVLTQEQMQSFYDAVASETEGITFTAEGQAGLSFTATDYRWTPAFTLRLEVAGLEGQGVTTGTLGGTYTASDGVITTTVGDNNLSATLTINGATQDGSELLGSFITSDPINDTPYDCTDPDAPVLQFETATGRTPIVLSPAG
jgi:hypothetical protein